MELESAEFNGLLNRLANTYANKTGDFYSWDAKTSETSITKAITELCINLNKRVLELESIVYGR